MHEIFIISSINQFFIVCMCLFDHNIELNCMMYDNTNFTFLFMKLYCAVTIFILIKFYITIVLILKELNSE